MIATETPVAPVASKNHVEECIRTHDYRNRRVMSFLIFPELLYPPTDLLDFQALVPVTG